MPPTALDEKAELFATFRRLLIEQLDALQRTADNTQAKVVQRGEARGAAAFGESVGLPEGEPEMCEVALDARLESRGAGDEQT